VINWMLELEDVEDVACMEVRGYIWSEGRVEEELRVRKAQGCEEPNCDAPMSANRVSPLSFPRLHITSYAACIS
jgi:hypothetical protein